MEIDILMYIILHSYLPLRGIFLFKRCCYNLNIFGQDLAEAAYFLPWFVRKPPIFWRFKICCLSFIICTISHIETTPRNLKDLSNSEMIYYIYYRNAKCLISAHLFVWRYFPFKNMGSSMQRVEVLWSSITKKSPHECPSTELCKRSFPETWNQLHSFLMN